MFRILLIFCVVAWSGVQCQNATIVQDNVLSSQTLSGHVQLGSNPSGLKNVLVEICSPDWKKRISSTITDEDGSFSFEKTKRAGLYHLRLSMPGTNTLLVR